MKRFSCPPFGQGLVPPFIVAVKPIITFRHFNDFFVWYIKQMQTAFHRLRLHVIAALQYPRIKALAPLAAARAICAGDAGNAPSAHARQKIRPGAAFARFAAFCRFAAALLNLWANALGKSRVFSRALTISAAFH